MGSVRRAARSGSTGLLRAVREAEPTWLLALIAMALACLAASYLFPESWPFSAYAIPLLLATNVLSSARMLLLDAVVGVCLVGSVVMTELTALRWLGICVIVVVAVIVLVDSRARARVGVGSARGGSMLVELRDRLASQSRLPDLPSEWYAQAVMRSSGGVAFAGDFIVAARTQHAECLEVVVVDVSGKGVGAGTRALVLSGALGGLLGSLQQGEFLPAANEYLLRQGWDEGFATAVHVAVHLASGEFEVRTAGHPPPVQFHAGSGRWTVHWTEGPVLGVVPGAEYSSYRGQLTSGDALLLYTDGLVETAHRDITYGIDKLVGQAERLVTGGFDRGAETLVAGVGSGSDDRAIVLLHRR